MKNIVSFLTKSGGGYDSDDLLYELEGVTLNHLSVGHEDVRTLLSEVIEFMAQVSVESLVQPSILLCLLPADQ